MSAPKKKAGTGTRPSATRSGTKAGGARPSIPKAAKSAGPQVSAAPGGGKRPPSGPTLVIGTIPVLTRVAGGVGLLAALLLLLRPAFPLVDTAGGALGGAHNLWDFLVVLPLVLAVGWAGVLCLLGRLPRFGLAILIAAGGYGLGAAIRVLPLFGTRTHSTLDLSIPEAAVSNVRYTVAGGLVLTVVAGLLLAVAAALALRAWRRTIMEDNGLFDPLRPWFAGFGMWTSVGAILAVIYPVADPLSAHSVGMPVGGILDRSGLDRLGILVQLVAFVAVAVGASVARPRLATVGMLLGLTAVSLTIWLTDTLLVVRSTELANGFGTIYQSGAWTWAALFTVLALLLRRRPRPPKPERPHETY
jgi:iron complex transport system permease protein